MELLESVAVVLFDAVVGSLVAFVAVALLGSVEADPEAAWEFVVGEPFAKGDEIRSVIFLCAICWVIL